jgi:hypothetical protein
MAMHLESTVDQPLVSRYVIEKNAIPGAGNLGTQERQGVRIRRFDR